MARGLVLVARITFQEILYYVILAYITMYTTNSQAHLEYTLGKYPILI